MAGSRVLSGAALSMEGENFRIWIFEFRLQDNWRSWRRKVCPVRMANSTWDRPPGTRARAATCRPVDGWSGDKSKIENRESKFENPSRRQARLQRRQQRGKRLHHLVARGFIDAQRPAIGV